MLVLSNAKTRAYSDCASANQGGPLRIVLKSVMSMKLKDQNGQSVNGIRCSFEFMNRETQRPIAVAMHAMRSREMYVNGGWSLGDVLRTTLVRYGVESTDIRCDWDECGFCGNRP